MKRETLDPDGLPLETYFERQKKAAVKKPRLQKDEAREKRAPVNSGVDGLADPQETPVEDA